MFLRVEVTFCCALFLVCSASGESGEIEKFNIVLFLAKTDGKSSCLDDSGLKCLNFEEKARVKHCASTRPDDPSSYASGIMNDCPDLLKDSLVSLISYARNVLGMTTAVASLDNDTFSNNLRMKKSNDDFEIQYNLPAKLIKRSLDSRNSYRMFPSGPRMQFEKAANQKRSRDDPLITDPEHREVFKLRTKRHMDNKRHHLDRQQEVKSILDNLGVIATIKLTFFGKLFDDDNEESDKCAPNNNGEDPDKSKSMQLDYMGQNVKSSCLFDLVKKTLYGLMETCESGFLVIVIGGNLVEISDPYSALVQSVKFVAESTDEKRTLIVVTGSCPPLDEEAATQQQEDAQVLIPVFVKGPRSDQIEHTTKLYDVPYSLKNILAGISIVEGGSKDPARFMNRRSKRQAASSSKRQTSDLKNDSQNKIPSSFIMIIVITIIISNLC